MGDSVRSVPRVAFARHGRSVILVRLVTAAAALLLYGALVVSPGQAQGNTYTVNDTGDAGGTACDASGCTLRQAISAANDNPGKDTIRFAISGAAPHSIKPTSPLPGITDPVVIDGTSEPDFAGAPVIELDGSAAPANADGLHITAGDGEVKGLIINRFPAAGIRLTTAGGNLIKGNFIGTDVSGKQTDPDGAPGSGDEFGNGESGVLIIASNDNTVGGSSPAERNVISGNGVAGEGSGVAVWGSLRTVISGNYIGTDVNGELPLGNNGNGVFTRDSAETVVGGTADVNPQGPCSGACNLISGNCVADICPGVFIGKTPTGDGVTTTLIRGNFIGTNANGDASLANGSNGVTIEDTSGNTVGGTTPEARNLISGNTLAGVRITRGGASDNEVLGNFIGTDSLGDGEARER